VGAVRLLQKHGSSSFSSLSLSLSSLSLSSLSSSSSAWSSSPEMLTTALPGGGGDPLIFAGLNGTGTAPSKLTPVPSKGPAIAAVELDGCDESDAPQSIGDDKLDVCSCCFGSGLDASAPWEGAATAEFP
jgi:hypothetical protein